MSERLSDSSDEILGERLRTDLPRYTAPPRLRATILQALDRLAKTPAGQRHHEFRNALIRRVST